MSNAEEKDSVVIEINSLVKSFGELQVLKGIDLIVKKGENVAVLGRSGSGKSVLIKIIAGLLKPDSGSVKVLGYDLADMTEKTMHAYRLKIGFSFQNSALYDSMTVEENIQFPLVRNEPNITKQEINKRVDAVLDAVGLRNTKMQMPSELSGGQKKRIGIARTLILNPTLMLYDEPTSGLDPITSIEINTLIKTLQNQYNTSAIVITHDLTCAKQTCNRLVLLSEGHFVQQGTFDEVFMNGNEFSKKFYEYNFIN